MASSHSPRLWLWSFLRGCHTLARIGVLAAILAMAAFPRSATASPPPGRRLLLFVGSNTLGEAAIPELARAYLEQIKKARGTAIEHDGDILYATGTLPDGSPVYVEIHATGSGDCFQSFLGLYTAADAPCDIGMASRRIRPDEADAIQQKTGSDLREQGAAPGEGCEHPVAMDGVAIVIPAANPVSRISFTELQGIYSGSITDWNHVADWSLAGAPAAGLRILPIRRKEPSGTLDFFKVRIQPAPGPMSDENQIPAYTSSSELVKKVAQTPGAIGFVGQSYAMWPGIKRLQVYNDRMPMMMSPEEAAFPDRDAVVTGGYPLSRVLYLYTLTISANEEVEPFIQFTLGDEGQTIIAAKAGLVKIAGTQYEVVNQDAPTPAAAATPPASPVARDGRKVQLILRLHGSNTVGAECAVNLAVNYFMIEREKRNSTARIVDETSPIETPEGERALTHNILCDLDNDGTWEGIEVLPTGSSDAFRDLHQGSCDIGMASRPISDAERNYLLPICGDLRLPDAQFVLGLDALAIIVSPASKISRLTLDQARQIFGGDVTDWSQVGGAPGSIHIHTRPDRSGTYKYFCDSVLMGRAVPDSARRHPENSGVADAVAKDPAGIGFVPMSTTGAARVLEVGEEGAATFAVPTEATVQSGEYPPALCRYLYLYVPASEPHSFTEAARVNWERARDFAESTQTWRGQAIVAASGFITETGNADEAGKTRRAPGEPVEAFIQRLAKLEKQASGLKPHLTDGIVCPRLLFDSNQWTLAPESHNIIDKKLGPWLKMYPAAAKEGLIAEGWTDSVGSDDACLALSLRRAQAVANYITETLGIRVTPVGKGKSFALPNTSEENKQQNRRVVIRLATPAGKLRPRGIVPSIRHLAP